MSCLSSCLLSQKWRFWRICSNILQDLAYQTLVRPCLHKSIGVASQYILWSGTLWYPLIRSMLKNKQIFSLVISKVIPDFSAVKLDKTKNHDDDDDELFLWYGSTNTSQKIIREVWVRSLSLSLSLSQNHNQTYSEPESYSKLRYIHNPVIFRNPLHSERWHIQNLRHIENSVTHLQWSSQIIIIFAKLSVLKQVSWGIFP